LDDVEGVGGKWYVPYKGQMHGKVAARMFSMRM